MSGLRRRKCEICGIKTCRLDGQKRVFMASFPLQEDRCKQWIAATGNENLIHIPIEKLNQQKFVCGKHFRRKDFKKKQTQLKKHAIPLIDIAENRLTDDMFQSFPLHTHTKDKSNTKKDHNYCSLSDREPTASKIVLDFIRKEVLIPKTSTLEISIENDCQRKWSHNPSSDKSNNPDHTYHNKSDGKLNFPDTGKPDCDDNGTTEVELSQAQQGLKLFEGDVKEDDSGDGYPDDGDKKSEGNQFSWQKPTKICIDDDDDFGNVPHIPTLDIEVEQAEEKPKVETISEDHKEYFCDSCAKCIVGFRYRCVECDNYDLCARCEAQARHDAHYMLRIPRPRPFSEIQSIIDAIREKIKGFTDNSLGLDEIKLEPDFIDPAASDPLCTPRVQTPLPVTDTLHEVPLAIPLSTPHTALHEVPLAIPLSTPHTALHEVPLAIPLSTPHTAAKTLRPNSPTYRKTFKPVHHIRKISTQTPTVIQLKDIKKPTAPVMDLLKKLNVMKDNENTQNYGNTSKRKLTTFVKKSFVRDKIKRLKDSEETLECHVESICSDSNIIGKGFKRKIIEDIKETWLDEDILDDNTSKQKRYQFVRDQKFNDTEETSEHRVENICDDGNTSGIDFKRKDIEDIEETWLDEDILNEEIVFTSEELEEDCEKFPTTRVTRSATKNENAPDT